jgi:hypothetical protein
VPLALVSDIHDSDGWPVVLGHPDAFLLELPYDSLEPLTQGHLDGAYAIVTGGSVEFRKAPWPSVS